MISRCYLGSHSSPCNSMPTVTAPPRHSDARLVRLFDYLFIPGGGLNALQALIVMIVMAGGKGKNPVQLFKQNHPRQLMGKREPRKGNGL